MCAEALAFKGSDGEGKPLGGRRFSEAAAVVHVLDLNAIKRFPRGKAQGSHCSAFDHHSPHEYLKIKSDEHGEAIAAACTLLADRVDNVTNFVISKQQIHKLSDLYVVDRARHKCMTMSPR